MVIFLIFLIIIFFTLLIFILIVLSTLEIKIDKFYLDTTKIKGKKIQFNSINVYLKLFNKIKWLNIKIDNKKLLKLQYSKTINKIIIKTINDILNNRDKLLDINLLKSFKTLNVRLKKIKLNLEVGTEDAICTSFLTTFISSILGILIANSIEKFDKSNYSYTITPKYMQKYVLKFDLDCIINVKMVHIINVIYTLIQKRREDNYARTSNRRPYDYSHE